MNTVFKYLFIQLLKMLGLVTAVIAVLELFLSLVAESSAVGTGGYSLHSMVLYVFMSLPNQVYCRQFPLEDTSCRYPIVNVKYCPTDHF